MVVSRPQGTRFLRKRRRDQQGPPPREERRFGWRAGQWEARTAAQRGAAAECKQSPARRGPRVSPRATRRVCDHRGRPWHLRAAILWDACLALCSSPLTELNIGVPSLPLLPPLSSAPQTGHLQVGQAVATPLTGFAAGAVGLRRLREQRPPRCSSREQAPGNSRQLGPAAGWPASALCPGPARAAGVGPGRRRRSSWRGGAARAGAFPEMHQAAAAAAAAGTDPGPRPAPFVPHASCGPRSLEITTALRGWDSQGQLFFTFPLWILTLTTGS
nr:uncharacterized protein LOC123858579 [Mirounga angustirostris]